MRGQVLGVDPDSRRGQIAGDDGVRYAFRPEDWSDLGEPSIGVRVDFEAEDRQALNVFCLPAEPASAERVVVVPVTDRNKYIAALLAFVIGTLGIHRFYLGRKGSAVVMLILSITFVGLLISVPWALVDMVRYLMMSDEEFAARYPRSHGLALGADGRPRSLPRR